MEVYYSKRLVNECDPNELGFILYRRDLSKPTKENWCDNIWYLVDDSLDLYVYVSDDGEIFGEEFYQARKIKTKPTKIRWYLAPNHNWIIQVLDNDNNEIACSIVGNYISRNHEVKEFKKIYKIKYARRYFDGEKCS